MNIKAEAFKKYVEEKNIKAFSFEELSDSPQHACIFRSFLLVEGQQLPVMIIFDDSPYSMIRVLVSPKARREENELKIFRAIDELNCKYKPFKLYFDQNGSVVLDVCITSSLSQTETDSTSIGDEIYTILNGAIQFLNENYRGIMKSIW